MRNLLNKRTRQIILYVFLDVISIAMGMGVPFFTILLGFLVGLFIPTNLIDSPVLSKNLLRSILKASFFISSISFVLLAILWLPSLSWLFDSTRNLANFGIPMILYTPLASFIGWIVLMVVISPFLQYLLAVFGSIARIVISGDQWILKETSAEEIIAA